jgi:hypothetical protein
MMFFLGLGIVFRLKKNQKSSFYLTCCFLVAFTPEEQNNIDAFFLRIAAFTGIHRFVASAPVRQGIKKQVLKPA